MEFFGGPKDGVYWGIGTQVIPKVRFSLEDCSGQERVHVYIADEEKDGEPCRRYIYQGMEKHGEEEGTKG